MINLREHNDYARDASLQGHKIEFKTPKREILEDTKESKDYVKKMARVSSARMIERHAKIRKRNSKRVKPSN